MISYNQQNMYSLLFGSMPRINYIEPDAFTYVFETPKWWKWYDIFRIWAKLKNLILLILINKIIKHSSSQSRTQRSKQKRKNYMHKWS